MQNKNSRLSIPKIEHSQLNTNKKVEQVFVHCRKNDKTIATHTYSNNIFHYHVNLRDIFKFKQRKNEITNRVTRKRKKNFRMKSYICTQNKQNDRVNPIKYIFFLLSNCRYTTTLSNERTLCI